MNERRIDMNKIRELRKLTGLSANKFGMRYGIPLRTVQNWELGKTEPPPYVVKLLTRCVLEDVEKEKEEMISKLKGETK